MIWDTAGVRLIDVSAKSVRTQWRESILLRNKGGVVVKALAFHQSRFRVQIWRRRHMSEGWVYCWFSPLLWEVFLPVSTQVFLSSQKPTRPNFSWISNTRTCLNEFLRTPQCFVGEQIIFSQGRCYSLVYRIILNNNLTATARGL